MVGRDIPSISVAVVDDLDRDMRHLLALLSRFQEENSVSFAVSTFTDGAALLDANVHDLDIILLDIQMAGIDGMKAAEALRAAGSDAVIIFVTKTAQYAVRGYSVQALGYLVKPASYLAFETEIRRALTQLSTRAKESVLIGSGYSLRRVPIADIIYMESNRHRITVFLQGSELEFTGTLKSFEAELADQGFFRSNSGYLINLRHLIALDGEDAVMRGGLRLKVARARKKGLLQALSAHIDAPIK